MAREKKTQTFEEIDENIQFGEVEQPSERIPLTKETFVSEPEEKKIIRYSESEEGLINCLTNEKVIVRFIARPRGSVTDPKHVLYGGMSPKAEYMVTTPLLRSGAFADVLTKEEKKYLEHAMGLEPNALSVYNRTNNFWNDANPNGLGRISLKKGDNQFDLSNPLDYIKVKVLRAYSDVIAPSMQALQDKPKATYKFVIIRESDVAKDANTKVSIKAQAYMEFGKINENKDILRTIIEIIEGRPTASNNKLEFLQGKVGELIESNTKLFLNTVKDPLLNNKVLIKKATEAGIITKKGYYLYLRDGNLPLCNNDQEPTLNVAAAFLAQPKNAELKYTIEAKLKASN